MFALPPSAPQKFKSAVEEVIAAERRRQWEKLVFIASESICHPEVAAVLNSPLSNVYAEGQPEPLLMHDPQEGSLDEARFDSWQTRLADGRYYRGCVGANRAELLAQRFVSQVFSRLPGSPARLPGDRSGFPPCCRSQGSSCRRPSSAPVRTARHVARSSPLASILRSSPHSPGPRRAAGP